MTTETYTLIWVLVAAIPLTIGFIAIFGLDIIEDWKEVMKK